jgi:large subunit ribosomal protein L21
MYAIIRSGGKQYRVHEGDLIDVERLDAEEGAEVTFDEVLLLENDGSVSVGAPAVAGASVTGRVEAHVRAKKLLSMKYKNKTRQRTLHGHRQHQTRIKIIGIKPGRTRRSQARES